MPRPIDFILCSLPRATELHITSLVEGAGISHNDPFYTKSVQLVMELSKDPMYQTSAGERSLRYILREKHLQWEAKAIRLRDRRRWERTKGREIPKFVPPQRPAAAGSEVKAGYRSDEEEAEYEVEMILEVRGGRGGRPLEYLIKWLWYPDSDNSWQPEGSMSCPQLLAEFWERRNGRRWLGNGRAGR